MTTHLCPPSPSNYDARATEAVIEMSDGLGRTMCIARALVENGRTVDLAGLEHGVGLLCAKALDLPPDTGRSVRPHLLTVLAEADALTASINLYAKP